MQSKFLIAYVMISKHTIVLKQTLAGTSVKIIEL